MTETRSSAEEARSLFVGFYRPGAGWQADRSLRDQPAVPEHVAFMKALFGAGHSLAAGPITNAHGGFILLHVRDIEEAKGLLADDPAVLAGTFAPEVYAWAPIVKSDKPLP